MATVDEARMIEMLARLTMRDDGGAVCRDVVSMVALE
jgi:hypothetical protein